MQTELHLSRENLVGLAILLGCDYIPKVEGSGVILNFCNIKMTDLDVFSKLYHFPVRVYQALVKSML